VDPTLDGLLTDDSAPIPEADEPAAPAAEEAADPRRRRRTPSSSNEPADVAEWFSSVDNRPSRKSTARAKSEPASDLKAQREATAARIVSALNPEQARAVTTTDGPLLILAGPARARPACSPIAWRTWSA
jgi:hypothetical protein